MTSPRLEGGQTLPLDRTCHLMPDARKKARREPAELKRLQESREWDSPWRRWGPYLSERQWGTVREDYSADGNAWEYFTHDHARSRAYHWGEDGLAGFCDVKQRLCFALSLWNGKDPILKERLFGLSNAEGNHGEDVKEYYFYLDSTPTHSYMKWLYRPAGRFPVRRSGDVKCRSHPPGARVRTRRHGRLRRRSLLRRRCRICQVVSGGMLRSYHRDEPGSSDRSDPFAAHAMVPEHVVLVAPVVETPPRGGRRKRRERGSGIACGNRRPLALLRWIPAAPVHRERHQYRADVRHSERDALRQGRFSRVRRSRAH